MRIKEEKKCLHINMTFVCTATIYIGTHLIESSYIPKDKSKSVITNKTRFKKKIGSLER